MTDYRTWWRSGYNVAQALYFLCPEMPDGFRSADDYDCAKEQLWAQSQGLA